MERRRGHIDINIENVRRLNEASRSLFASDRRIQKEFSRTIGQRTFQLIDRIGVDRKSSFGTWTGIRINDVQTSLPLKFQFPGTNKEYALRFELDATHQLITLPHIRPSKIFKTAAELTQTFGDQTLKRSISLQSSEYVNGTVIDNPELGYKRGGVPEYANKIITMKNILNLGEAVIGGRVPTASSEKGDGLQMSLEDAMLWLTRPAIEGPKA